MSTDYTPYTYLLGWSKHNIYYYGVQYANNKQTVATPSNLWSSYYTSSIHVKNFITKNGDPDIIQIRKTFTNRIDAQLWESKVLRRLQVRNNSKWLNINPGGSGFMCPSGENHSCYGKPRSLETKQKMSTTRKLKAALGLITYNHHSLEQLNKVKQTGRNNAKPKENKVYVCIKCDKVFQKLEYKHHTRKPNFICKNCKPGRPPIPVSINDIIYRGEKEAANALNMSIDQIRWRISSKKYPSFNKLKGNFA